MEKFSSAEKQYTHEDLEKAQEELRTATDHFNSFNNGEDMSKEKEDEYLTQFAAARDNYAEKTQKVKEIEEQLGA